MTFIEQIAVLPAPYAYPSGQLLSFLEDRHTDPQTKRKFRFLAKDNSIGTRYSVLPDFDLDRKPMLYTSKSDPSTQSRMLTYDRVAPKMAEQVARELLSKADVAEEEITAVIAVSCTGHRAPGLEIELARSLGLDKNTQRFAVNFMGCYAAFHGLRLADLICTSDPNAKVLLVCVELCSLHFRLDTSDDNLLSTILFADGAAAVLLTGEKACKIPLASIHGFDSTLIDDSSDAMGWAIGNTGFEMVLNRKVPTHLLNGMRSVFDDSLKKYRIDQASVNHYAIHPGGKSILDAFEKALELEPSDLQKSRDVLERYGNMSSPTVLFVLDRIIADSKAGDGIYSAAFGPGLTVESAFIEAL